MIIWESCEGSEGRESCEGWEGCEEWGGWEEWEGMSSKLVLAAHSSVKLFLISS